MQKKLRTISIVLILIFTFFLSIFLFIRHEKSDESKFVPASQILTVYTTIPKDMAQVIANDYLNQEHVQIKFVFLSPDDVKSKIESSNHFSGADMIITDSEILNILSNKNLLVPISTEQEDVVLSKFKDENSKWIGIWYDPIVFCYNMNYVKNNWYLPLTWQNLGFPSNNIKIVMTDFVASRAASNLLYSLAETHGIDKTLQLLQDINYHIIRYTKYLSTPVRMAAMGEADAGITVQSEAIRYINDKYPLTIVYPEDKTAYLLTGVGVFKGSSQLATAKNFINYLLSDNVQIALNNSSYYYVPTNQETISYKSYSVHNIKLLDRKIQLDEKQKKELLDNWISNVRFKH